MAFDKAKAVSAAERNLAQGKIAAAVQEYQRIADADPDDFTALNTLGDLYARLDKKAEAVQCFVRVADHYREQGFALKAIAIYKKVARLRPEELSVAQKLAVLYEQQGLIVEARAQYLSIADACTRAKQMRDALEALRRTADLDPQNADIRLRLAEGFAREGMNDEAGEAFAEAGTRLHARNDYQGALRAFTLARGLRPYNHEILQGLVNANLALGANEDAASVLEEAVAQVPADMELQAMLARVYLEAEDAPAADRAAQQLIAADQSNYPLLFEVAQLYLQQGDTVNGVRALTSAVEPALAKRQEKPLLELLNQALARDPENIESLRLLLRIHTWQRDDDRMRIALERLAEAAQAQELYDDERNALEHLVRLVPFDQSYAERLTALAEVLGTDMPRPDTAHEGILTSGEDATYAEPARGTETPAPNAPAAPSFDGMFETNSGANDLFIVPPPPSTTPPAPAGEFEWNAVAPPAAPEQHADTSASFADLNAEFTDAAADFTLPHVGGEEQEIHVSPSLDESALPGASRDAAAADQRVQTLLAQELESVDYYLAQGYMDIARDTLDMLERQYGASAEIGARRQRLHTSPAPASAQAQTDHDDKTEDVTFEVPAEHVHPAESPARSPQPPPQVFVAAQAGAHTLDAGLAEVFAEFRDSVEDDGADTTADYETHYNTGLAYMEMGMIDMAVEEFQTAITVVAPGDGTPRYLQCCNLLGHCFMQQDMARAAALWFQKGLAAPGHTEEEYQALRYELAAAYEQLGDLDRALDILQEVYGIDVSYRGVADKLKELQGMKAVTGDR